jgi:hypothetical protein
MQRHFQVAGANSSGDKIENRYSTSDFADLLADGLAGRPRSPHSIIIASYKAGPTTSYPERLMLTLAPRPAVQSSVRRRRLEPWRRLLQEY